MSPNFPAAICFSDPYGYGYLRPGAWSPRSLGTFIGSVVSTVNFVLTVNIVLITKSILTVVPTKRFWWRIISKEVLCDAKSTN